MFLESLINSKLQFKLGYILSVLIKQSWIHCQSIKEISLVANKWRLDFSCHLFSLCKKETLSLLMKWLLGRGKLSRAQGWWTWMTIAWVLGTFCREHPQYLSAWLPEQRTTEWQLFSWSPKFKVRAASSWGLQKESVPFLIPTFWCFAGSLWCFLTGRREVLRFAFSLTWLCPRVSVGGFIWSSFKDTSHIGVEVLLTPP